MKSKSNYVYIIFLLFLIAVLSSGVSFSRYISTLANTGDQSTSITVNKYNLSVTWGIDPDAVQYPGITEQSYEFTLENTEATDLLYTITIAMDWNEATPGVGLKVPLNMELYVVDSGESLDPVTTISPGGMSINSIQTPEAVIIGEEEIKFCLIWDWGTGDEDRDYRFANKAIDVKIDVNAEQYAGQ
jgi:hypothetical protein